MKNEGCLLMRGGRELDVNRQSLNKLESFLLTFLKSFGSS